MIITYSSFSSAAPKGLALPAVVKRNRATWIRLYQKERPANFNAALDEANRFQRGPYREWENKLDEVQKLIMRQEEALWQEKAMAKTGYFTAKELVARRPESVRTLLATELYPAPPRAQKKPLHPAD